MHITTVTLIVSILALLFSFGFVGIIPSLLMLIINIVFFIKVKSIKTLRPLAVSAAGVLLPVIMYCNCYGLSLPYEKWPGLSFIPQIIYENYSALGFDMDGMFGISTDVVLEDIYYVSDGVIVDEAEGPSLDKVVEKEDADDTGHKFTGLDALGGDSVSDLSEIDEENILESIDSFDEDNAGDYGADKKGPSDDDMPSYGGLPIGVMIMGQFFREDDHNCNPVLVLKNETGETYRFECVFTARDEEGNPIATSQKTVESVPDGVLFVFEGRFDKSELGGELPSMYEFLISKREPYEKDMYDQVTVFGKTLDNSVLLTARNHSRDKIKVDAYVLFFDGEELVDCVWMIPRNDEDVTIAPDSFAVIRADAYYKFDRIETYYTAYEAVDGVE